MHGTKEGLPVDLGSPSVSKGKSGGDLLFRRLSPPVPLALEGLTSVFGMGTGVAPPLYPPEIWRPEVGGQSAGFLVGNGGSRFLHLFWHSDF